MKRRAHAKRRDLNEPEIVDALRRLGCKVYLQDGPVDLLVGRGSRTYHLEVKRGDLAPAARELTPDERAFLRDWNGNPAAVVRCIEEALCVVRIAPCRQKQGNHETRFCECGGIEDPSWFTAERARLAEERRLAKKTKKG
jgi:hypothetical protein